MLNPEPVVRDEEGYWVHSAVLAADEETAWQDLPGADGMEFRHVHFFRDAPAELIELYDRASECELTAEGPRFSDAVKEWNPKPPEGDGWWLAGIYDTEDGPYACFARPKQQ